MSKELKKGCVVYMKRESGMVGYGNAQCVSFVSHELGELGLYGHNEHYKTYDVREIIEHPQDAKREAIGFAEWVFCRNAELKHGIYIYHGDGVWEILRPSPYVVEIEKTTTEQLYSLYKSKS